MNAGKNGPATPVFIMPTQGVQIRGKKCVNQKDEEERGFAPKSSRPSLEVRVLSCNELGTTIVGGYP